MCARVSMWLFFICFFFFFFSLSSVVCHVHTRPRIYADIFDVCTWCFVCAKSCDINSFGTSFT